MSCLPEHTAVTLSVALFEGCPSERSMEILTTRVHYRAKGVLEYPSCCVRNLVTVVLVRIDRPDINVNNAFCKRFILICFVLAIMYNFYF